MFLFSLFLLKKKECKQLGILMWYKARMPPSFWCQQDFKKRNVWRVSWKASDESLGRDETYVFCMFSHLMCAIPLGKCLAWPPIARLKFRTSFQPAVVRFFWTLSLTKLDRCRTRENSSTWSSPYRPRTLNKGWYFPSTALALGYN